MPRAASARPASSGRWWLATWLFRDGARLLRTRAGFRGRSFVGRFLRAMGRTSPPGRSALPEHPFREARLDRALRHPPVPGVVEDELLEARLLPTADEVMPGLL